MDGFLWEIGADGKGKNSRFSKLTLFREVWRLSQRVGTEHGSLEG
jgi:hypothetical protein